MKFLEALALSTLAVFAPIQAGIITAFVLICIDLATGLVAAKKRGEKITSAKIKRTIGKVFLYEIAICVAFLVQQYLTGELFPAAKLVTALVGLVELKSVLENLDSISGTSTFKIILSKITKSKDDLGGSST